MDLLLEMVRDEGGSLLYVTHSRELARRGRLTSGELHDGMLEAGRSGVIRLLLSSLQRHFRESRTLFLLTVVGVALGVASVVAIQTLNQGAMQAFDGSVRAVSGQADLSVLGVTPAFDEKLLVTVLADPAVAAAWPLCRVDVAVRGGRACCWMWWAWICWPRCGCPLARWRETPSSAVDSSRGLVTTGLGGGHPRPCRGTGLGRGRHHHRQQRQPLRPAGHRGTGRFPGPGTAGPSHPGRHGHRPGPGPAGPARPHPPDRHPAAARAATRKRWPRVWAQPGPGLKVVTPEQRSQDAAGLLAAFRLNLTALSLISVFVGRVSGADQRAGLACRDAGSEFGLLRCLGARPGQVLGLIVAETAILGVLGVAVGDPAGLLGGPAEYRHGQRHPDQHLRAAGHRQPGPAAWRWCCWGWPSGLLGAVAGAVWPAVDMARRDTLHLLAPVTLQEQTGQAAGRLTWVAVVLAAGCHRVVHRARIGTCTGAALSLAG